MATVQLDNICKGYGAGALAVDCADFTVADGEFMILLGPSGCGKSTTLRMIAGLESITSGHLSINGRVMNDVPAKDRDIAMVFQSYALYPHMTVADNLGFGLRRRSVASAEITRRVAETADILGLTPYLQRKPNALSGGQRQRVALGRAMVREPQVFLFDEPLSNLDAALRVATRNELIRQHHRLGSTMIYVTHDQVEAMTMGSRICVMNAGRVVQTGAPLEVYWNPADTFVARFLGSPPMNLMDVPVFHGRVDALGVSAALDRWSPATLAGHDGATLTMGVRAEDLALGEGPPGAGYIDAQVFAVEPLGAETLLAVETEGARTEITARLGRHVSARVGEAVRLHFDPRSVYLFDPATTRAIPAGPVMLRVGLIGAGMVSRHHLIGWSRLAGTAQVVAIADPVNAAQRAAEFGIGATYASAAAMLQAETLDAVDIAAPRLVHVELVRLAAAAGLAVLCQKPLAPDLAQAEALTAEMADSRLMVHENWRFRRYYRDAANWIGSGSIGAVQQCSMTLLTSGLLPGPDGSRPALVRQSFMQAERRMLVNEVLIHHLDTLRVLLGPLEVTASRLGRSCADMAGEDNALLTLRAESGAGAVLLGNMAAPGFPPAQADQMTVVGTEGSITLDGPVLTRLGARPARLEYDLTECYQGSYDAVIAHFVECLLTGAAFETTPEDNLHTLRLVEDAYRLADWRPA